LGSAWQYMAIHRAVERSIVTMASGSFLASLQKKRSAPASLNKTKCWDAVGENHDQKCDKNNRKEPVEDRVDQWWEPIRRCYLRAAAHRGLGCTPYTVLESWGQDPMEQV
jgi:hypothetical protein